MQTSARNMFSGTVTKVTKGAVNFFDERFCLKRLVEKPSREQLAHFFIAELAAPLFDQPIGVRPDQSGLGELHVGEDFLDFRGFAQIAAQNGIDKACLRVVT